MARRTMKPTGVRDIMKALQRLMLDYLATDWPLTADASPGDTIISVLRSGRYRVGDEVFLKSEITGLAEPAVIKDILPWDSTLGYQIELEDPLQGLWTTANASSLLKALNHQPLKRVFRAPLNIIPDFPSVSISLPDESNEWWTLRATNHEYTFKIRAHIKDDNFEVAADNVARLGEYIREILIDHIHPVVDDPPIVLPLTSDLPAGSTVVPVSDTSQVIQGDRAYLRDGEFRPAGSQETAIQTILGPTTVRLTIPTEFDYLVARGAELIIAQRYLYDTRPSGISYGAIPGATAGSFSYAAEISYFAKEAICRKVPVIS